MKYSRLVSCTVNHVLEQIRQRKAIVCQFCIARTLQGHIVGDKTAITSLPLCWKAMIMLLTITIFGKPD